MDFLKQINCNATCVTLEYIHFSIPLFLKPNMGSLKAFHFSKFTTQMHNYLNNFLFVLFDSVCTIGTCNRTHNSV